MHFLFTAPFYHTNQHFPVKALLAAGHQVSYLALTHDGSTEYSALTPTILGFSRTYDMYLRLSGLWKRDDPTAVLNGRAARIDGVPPFAAFWNELRRRDPDVIVIRNPFTAYGRRAVLAGCMMRKKLILYSQAPLRSLPPLRARRHPWKRPLTKLLLRAADTHWMTPLLGDHEQATRIANCRYVPFVMEPQTRPDRKSWFNGGNINLLSIGRYQRRKNLHLFLDVVSRLSGRFPVRWTIIGVCATSEHREELADLEARSVRLGIAGTGRFEVNLSFSEVQKEYQRHDVFVLPSRMEPAAISPLEAMAHSLPVVCSDTNGTRCYVRADENGLVFRSDDADDLEACLGRMMRDRARLRQMGARSYELVLTEHSPGRYVEELVSMAEG